MAHPTVADVLVLVRAKIDDPDARRHTTVVLCNYLNFAQRRIAELAGRIKESGWFEKQADAITFSAGDETKALPTDFLAANLVELSVTGGGRQPLHPIERRQMSQARGLSSSSPLGYPFYFIRRAATDDGGGVLGLLPPHPSEARTVYVTYVQAPAACATDGSGSVGVHDFWREPLVLRAAMFALNDEEDSGSVLANNFASVMAHLLSFAQGSQDRAHTEQVGMEDFADDEDY